MQLLGLEFLFCHQNKKFVHTTLTITLSTSSSFLFQALECVPVLGRAVDENRCPTTDYRFLGGTRSVNLVFFQPLFNLAIARPHFHQSVSDAWLFYETPINRSISTTARVF